MGVYCLKASINLSRKAAGLSFGSCLTRFTLAKFVGFLAAAWKPAKSLVVHLEMLPTFSALEVPSGPPGGAIHNHTVSVTVNWDLCRQIGLCLHPITENLPQELIENQPRVRYGATVTQKTPPCPRRAQRSQVPLDLLSNGLCALGHTKHRGYMEQEEPTSQSWWSLL